MRVGTNHRPALREPLPLLDPAAAMSLMSGVPPAQDGDANCAKCLGMRTVPKLSAQESLSPSSTWRLRDWDTICSASTRKMAKHRSSVRDAGIGPRKRLASSVGHVRDTPTDPGNTLAITRLTELRAGGIRRRLVSASSTPGRGSMVSHGHDQRLSGTHHSGSPSSTQGWCIKSLTSRLES